MDQIYVAQQSIDLHSLNDFVESTHSYHLVSVAGASIEKCIEGIRQQYELTDIQVEYYNNNECAKCRGISKPMVKSYEVFFVIRPVEWIA